MSFAWLFLVSIVAGGLGSLSGVGGGVVLIPVLTFFGADIKEAIAASTLSVIAISISAAPSYIQRHMPSLKTATFLETFAISGAFIGALTTLVTGRNFLFILCGAVLLFFCVSLWREQDARVPVVTNQDPLSRWLGLEGCYYDDVEGRTISYQGNHAFLGGFLMFVAGLTTGFLGMGGSVLAVLILNRVIRLPTKVSLTTSNLIIGVMALAGADVYLEAGLINPQLAIPVILGTPLGAFMGAKLLVQLQNRIVRFILIGVLLLWGIEMVMHGVRKI